MEEDFDNDHTTDGLPEEAFCPDCGAVLIEEWYTDDATHQMYSEVKCPDCEYEASSR